MERFILAHSLEILVHGLVGLLLGGVYGGSAFSDGQVCGGKSMTGKNLSPMRED